MAFGLLALMAAQTVFAAVTAAGNGFSLVVNLALGALATWLLYSVVGEVRRSAAADHAEVAVRSAAQANERAREHAVFATTLGRQLTAARVEVARARADIAQAQDDVTDALHEAAQALGEAVQARHDVAQWSARTLELEARLSEAETELAQARDALWVSEAAEKRARAELVIAEEQPRHLRPA